MILHCGSRSVDLSTPQVMGVLNVTPDSFYDGGRLYGASSLVLEKAIRAAEEMHSAGAAFIDIGGESTRPGAAAIGEQEECDRVLPVVEALAERLDVVLSVDTSTAKVMMEAASLGAGLINDVRSLERDGALDAAIATQLPVCLMHMLGNPKTMQENPAYRDVVSEVDGYLRQRVETVQGAARRLGVGPPQLLLDPGFGFGKTDEHNLALLRDLYRLSDRGFPLLVGVSRKSMIGRLLNREPEQRLAGSLALAFIAVQNGANILRVHDVVETADVIRILNAVRYGDHIHGA
ncbi:dihydropteroate synthase [Teredinibacter haidensis]|uniref:dihydropteroate synthase n=1 Tax=Teredinibacter haidensis TaxID=2731755 RepID=UPI0009491F57|nr:dihydropteroate synthase [Teredinibacter haidensis]